MGPCSSLHRLGAVASAGSWTGGWRIARVRSSAGPRPRAFTRWRRQRRRRKQGVRAMLNPREMHDTHSIANILKLALTKQVSQSP